MALNPSNSSNLEQLALKGLICRTYQRYHRQWLPNTKNVKWHQINGNTEKMDRSHCRLHQSAYQHRNKSHEGTLPSTHHRPLQSTHEAVLDDDNGNDTFIDTSKLSAETSRARVTTPRVSWCVVFTVRCWRWLPLLWSALGVLCLLYALRRPS